MSQTYVGKVVRKPVIRPKVIFTSVEIENGKTLQAVVFPNKVSYSVKNAFSTANEGDEIAFTGKLEVNKYNGEEQIVVANIEDRGADNNVQYHSNGVPVSFPDSDESVPQAASTTEVHDPVRGEVRLHQHPDGNWIDQHGFVWNRFQAADYKGLPDYF